MTSSPLQWKTATKTRYPDELWDDVAFAWEIVRYVKSNAIVLAKDTSLIGVGAGQMSRVDSVEIAIDKAGDRARRYRSWPPTLSFPFPTRSKLPPRQASSPSFNQAVRVATRRSSTPATSMGLANGSDRSSALQTLMTILDKILVETRQTIERDRAAIGDAELEAVAARPAPLSRFSCRAGCRFRRSN